MLPRLAAKAHELADQLGVRVTALAASVEPEASNQVEPKVSNKVEPEASNKKDAAAGGEEYVAVVEALATWIAQGQPEIFLTDVGRESSIVAARLAERLGLGMIRGCGEVRIDTENRLLVGVREIWPGLAVEAVIPQGRPQIATLLTDRLPEPPAAEPDWIS